MRDTIKVELPPRDVRGVIFRSVSHFADVIVGEIVRARPRAVPGASPAAAPVGSPPLRGPMLSSSG